MKKIVFIFLLLILGLASCGKKEVTHKVTYLVDGAVVKVEEVKEGEAAKDYEPTKEGYEFYGWDKNLSNITEDVETNAVFEKMKYTLNYYVDDKLVHSEIVLYGEDGIYKSRPNKEGHTFTGWNPSPTNVKSNLDVHAVFEKKSFTVTFVDLDGTTIDEQTVLYDEDAVAPDAPAHDGYQFLNWEGNYQHIKEDTTIEAKYKKIKCDVKFYVEGALYDTSISSYTIGTKVTLPVLTLSGYDFLGWTLSPLSQTVFMEIDESFTGDINFYALLLETEIHNPIVLPETDYHFTGLKEVTASNGTVVLQPIFPSNAPSSSVQNYNWSTSDSNIATVSQWSSLSIAGVGYCVLTATLKENSSVFINCVIHCTPTGATLSSVEEANNIKLVTITFKDDQDNVIVVKKTQKGGSVIYPIPPTYNDRAFIGWDKDNYNLTSDTTITARYDSTKTNKFVGKSFSIVGDSISTFASYIPKGFASFYPYPTADVNDMNLTWWMRVINGVGGTLFVNNSYSGTCVADNSSNATKNLSRMKYCLLGEKAPDVILIFMGANDCASGSISADTFDQGYEAMLSHLRTLCPNSEVILLTLPTTSFYSSSRQIALNNVIKAKATKYSLQLIDVSSVNLDGHKVDGAHPNSSGMKLVGDTIIKQMVK